MKKDERWDWLHRAHIAQPPPPPRPLGDLSPSAPTTPPPHPPTGLSSTDHFPSPASLYPRPDHDLKGLAD